MAAVRNRAEEGQLVFKGPLTGMAACHHRQLLAIYMDKQSSYNMRGMHTSLRNM
jgi:hypothetical protein